MNPLQEARRTALNIEEAALLPALRARSMDGGAALLSARRAEEQMKRMTLGREMPWGQARAAVPAAPRAGTHRAALNHVLAGRRS